MSAPTSGLYEGTGKNLEEAVKNAHQQIPLRQGKDFVISKVVEWGFCRGGFIDVELFYAKVIEDEFSPLKAL
jgi:hypothetical protein